MSTNPEVPVVPVVPVATTGISVPATAVVNTAVGGLIIPDDIPDDREGLDDLIGMIKPLRVKVVQALSDEKKTGKASEGDVLLKPVDVKIAALGESITIVPIFSFTEYLALNPRGLVAARPELYWLRDSSRDAKSTIAHKARNRVTEDNPEGAINRETNQPWQVQYVVAYNYVVWLVRDNTMALLTFMKGEAKYGERLGQLIQLRNRSMYTGQYDLTIEKHRNQRGDEWVGLTPANCKESPWAPAALRDMLKDQRAKLVEAYNSATLVTEYDDEVAVDPTAQNFEGN